MNARPARSMVVDSHNDTIVGLLRRGGESLAGPDAPARPNPEGAIAFTRSPLDSTAPPIQLNLPKLRAAGIDVAYFAVDVTRARNNHLAYALDGIGWFLEEVAAHSDQIAIATNIGEIHRANTDGKIAAVLAVENSEVLERSLSVLSALYRLGVRSLTLTWSYRTWAADGEQASHSGGGLTDFGRDLVAKLNELGMLVDISHISDAGFWDVIEASSGPVIGTHNCCRALCEHGRNLTDDQIRALAATGGVVGVTFVEPFVHPTAPTLDLLLDHIQHLADIGGIDCVGLGSDFDGGGELLPDATHFPRIAAGLSERGWSDGDLEKLLGLNHLRVFAAVCG